MSGGGAVPTVLAGVAAPPVLVVVWGGVAVPTVLGGVAAPTMSVGVRWCGGPDSAGWVGGTDKTKKW